MYRLLFVITFVYGRTVTLTNIPPETSRNTKTYEIEVPGKEPIRIIEADPPWNTFRRPQSLDFNFNRISTTEEPPTTLSTSTLVENSTKIYSPEALNAFLKSYAEKIREKKRRNTTSSEEKIDRVSDVPLEESDDDYDKSKRWGLINTRKPNPYEEKDGWVTMDAIPWSSSQISKWQSSHKPKPEYQRPDNFHFNDFNKPYSNYDYNRPYSKPSKPQKPIYSYDQTPFSVQSQTDLDRVYQKPASSYNIHVSNRPTWNEDRKPYITVAYDNYPIDDDRDIITDGKPNDFPTRYVPVRRPYEPLQERPSSNVHPMTHPQNGNGEWVLLSTTKGYQYPRQKQQRAIAITPNSIGVKRSVRLTVLPPDENSKINMTTSHGGLLEVDATFETVEESQKVFSERLQVNKTRPKPTRPILKLKKKPIKIQPKTDSSLNLPVIQQDSRMTHQPDTSAVLAAIGAGMVPATMAMLMPFVNGRKRRSIDGFRNVVNATNVPFTDYELTLQSY